MDTQESLRRFLIATGAPEIKLAEAREQDPEQVLDTEAFKAQFEALVFLAPLVRVRRRVDGVVGWLMFTHNPRFYFCFVTEEELKP